MPEADLAWLLAAFALVLLMFPGIALFYGGMVSARHTLNMTMMIFGGMALSTVIYVLIGHGMVVGNSVGGLGLIGNPFEYFSYEAFLSDDGANGTYWSAFFILFAAISSAVVASGAVGRMKFWAWLVFTGFWQVLVYYPLAHWVFTVSDPESGYVGGWMRNILGLHDFAGGTAVHMNAGVSALALALVLGPRKLITRPHNLPFVVLGAGILFMGWMGFNGGTAATASFFTEYVILTTLLAAMGGIIGFLVFEKFHSGSATTLGMASGMISGLVGITPSADAVNPIGAILVGVFSGLIVAWVITLIPKSKIDESLDAFPVHTIGGIVGALFVVFFGAPGAPAGVAGVFFGGDPNLIWKELVAIVVTCVYAFVVSFLILWVMKKIAPIRVSDEVENAGLDEKLHAETAYEL